MKLKQIEAILKAEKTIIVSETPSCQWLGNGAAFYPFYFEERELPSFINFEDGDESEEMLDRGSIAFYAQGRTLEPLKTSQGIAFINTRYLKPFADSQAGYELYERTDKLGRPYIVVKSGFVLLGVIFPYDLVNEGFVQTLEEILNLSKATLFNKQEKSRAADGYKQIELGEEVE